VTIADGHEERLMSSMILRASPLASFLRVTSMISATSVIAWLRLSVGTSH
jgi:hypothetical protein